MPGALKTVAHNKDHPKPIKVCLSFQTGHCCLLWHFVLFSILIGIDTLYDIGGNKCKAAGSLSYM